MSRPLTPGGGPATPERYVCGAVAALPLRLVSLALEITPGERGHPLDVATRLRCVLERHTDGPHSDLVREVGRSAGEVWTQWEDGGPPEYVCLLPDCPADNGEPGGANEACTLYEGHSGAHSYHCADAACPDAACPDAACADPACADDEDAPGTRTEPVPR
ncbi:hypothetical protein [Streptomyces yaizuensis]|uniref:Uncharacterized protein n=1 Tax=Streptomyces yaizuensis TaxID=2989713 RepID=A0ABQ5P439_9ACTN|nr:hypothetical protein [Streptomyces sp. YSPA8]GLF97250.1 hypothetical protein SYYSPA8_23155 [Streptomyces sp. YSPA8]